MKITTYSKTETRYYSNVPLDEKTISETSKVFDNLDSLFDKPQKVVIDEGRNDKPLSKFFKGILLTITQIVFLVLLFSIFVYFGLNDNHNPIFITIMVVSIPVGLFCAFIKALDTFGKAVDYISKHWPYISQKSEKWPIENIIKSRTADNRLRTND